MPHVAWHQLSDGVRTAIENQTGPLLDVASIDAGSVADFVAVLHTASGMTFCKGARDDNPRAWMQRREAELNPYLPPFAPKLRWQIATDGWSLLGFEHAPGRHVQVAPRSPDLSPLAATLATMSSIPAPTPPARIQPATVRWAQWLAPEVVDGDALVHTDVTTKNFLIDDSNARISVVDWSMPCRGAAWLDTALMVIRLIRAGHTPTQAAEWADQIPAWTRATPSARAAFAAACATRSADRAGQSSAEHLHQLATAATQWARYTDAVTTSLIRR